MSLTAIILAAGKSTRMKSKRPKGLHEICGRPMLQYILDACYEAGVSRILLVVGHGKDEIDPVAGGEAIYTAQPGRTDYRELPAWEPGTPEQIARLADALLWDKRRRI